MKSELQSRKFPYQFHECEYTTLLCMANDCYQKNCNQTPQAGEVERMVLEAASKLGYKRHFEKQNSWDPKPIRKAGIIQVRKP